MRHSERGMATVELAFASLAIALVTLVVGWFVMALGVLGHCQTTANEVARQRARGDAAAVALVMAQAPAGASVKQAVRGGVVEVVVETEVRFGSWLALPVAARAHVLEE